MKKVEQKKVVKKDAVNVDELGFMADMKRKVSFYSSKDWFLPALVGGAVGCTLVGVGLHAMFSTPKIVEVPVEVTPTDVAQVKQDVDLLERKLDGVKDSQLRALFIKVAKLESADRAGLQDYPLGDILAVQTRHVSRVDGFLDTVFSVPPSAGESDLLVAREGMARYMTTSAGVTKAYEILQGKSASKILGENVRRNAPSTMFLVDYGDNSLTYLVVTGFATSKDLHHQLSMITVNFDGNVSDYRYVGMLDSVEPGDFESALHDLAKLNLTADVDEADTPRVEETQHPLDGEYDGVIDPNPSMTAPAPVPTPTPVVEEQSTSTLGVHPISTVPPVPTITPTPAP